MTATSLHSSTRTLLGDAFRSFTTGIAHDGRHGHVVRCKQLVDLVNVTLLGALVSHYTY